MKRVEGYILWAFLVVFTHKCYIKLQLLVNMNKSIWNWVTLSWSISVGGSLGYVNTLRPRQNGRHFADDIFKCIFPNENIWISIQFSPKFVPKGPINNIPALVQIMAWRRLGDKPLSELMMVSLLTHICVTRPEWVNLLRPTDVYMR